jgi:hypothetical protein
MIHHEHPCEHGHLDCSDRDRGPCSDEHRELFRVDVQGVGETIWVSNAMRFGTEEEAEAYARDLFARWMGMQTWRVVPESTPEREEVA